MNLSTGDRVGPYEVLEQLGAGGMGQVFRARDARLKRDVALKVLTSAAGDGRADRARFEREAQVLASLSHPRIAQVFGVEDAGGTPVIVMELVDGPTLADRLARGALPLDETLAVAVQICDGLEAAHERGIIHRDLKPANIKLRGDGSVTILDFGLARAIDGEGSDPAGSPTMVAATAVGVVMGTAAYMSPEQARARAVDKRTDIWAFGCVLFEMLAGAPAFAGESTTDVLAAVVQTDPDWTKLPTSTPPRVVDVVRRCLQKSVKDRLRDIADARYELLHAEPSAANPSPAGLAAANATRHSGIVPVAGFAAGVLVAGVAAFVIAAARAPKEKPTAPVRSTITLPANTTLALSRGSAIALSPDGRLLAFAGRNGGKTQLYLRPLDRYESHPIPSTDDAQTPFFSPDGRWIGFFADNKLKKVAVDGGAPVTISDAPVPRGDAWAVDDTILITPANTDPVMRVSALGGKPTPATKLDEGEMSHRWPRLLPGGRAMLFAIWNDNGWEPSRIAAQRLDSMSHAVVVEAGGGYPHYVRDGASDRGFLVYARAEGLLAARFDEAALSLVGQPVPVVDSVMTNLSGGAHFDLSAMGTLAYVTGAAAEAERELAWVDPNGRVEPLSSVHIPGRVYRLSPDGAQVARQNPGDSAGGIYSQDLVRGTRRRLSESSDDFAPAWSHDGRFVVYTRGVRHSAILRRPVAGGPEETILTSDLLLRTEGVSPDGRWVIYVSFDPVTGADIWVAPTDRASGAARPLVKTKYTESFPQFSPDNRWVAYQSNASGRFEVYVRAFPGGEPTLQLTTDGAFAPLWAPDGRQIYYYAADGHMMALPLDPTDSDLRPGRPRALFDAKGYETSAAIAPDGKRFLMMPLMKSENEATQIQLVTDFLAELEQRVR